MIRQHWLSSFFTVHVTVAFLPSCAVAALLPGIYYSESDFPGTANDPNVIKRANLDGSQQVVIATAYASFGIDSSPITGHIYWTDSKETNPSPQIDLIARADSQGNGRQNLITTGLNFPFEISIDDVAGKMYWTNSLSGKLERASLDGSSRELLLQLPTGSGVPFLRAVHVDDRNGDVYYGLQGEGLFKLPKGSSSPISLINGVSPFGLDIDPLENKIYWTDVSADRVRRARLDGTGVEDIVVGNITLLGGLCLDLVGRKVYWADQLAGTISRANLDGSAREILISTDHIPFAVEIVPVPEPMAVQLLVIGVLFAMRFSNHRNRMKSRRQHWKAKRS
jgi:hypothetical protein